MTLDELRTGIADLLEEYAAGSPHLVMPSLCEWAIVAAVDDIDDATTGRIIVLAPKNVWPHRVVGLLQVGMDYPNVGGLLDEDEDDN